MKGLILISPVLDFREFTGSSLLQYVVEPADHGGGGARGQGPGHARRHGRRRAICARRFPRRPRSRARPTPRPPTRLADKVAALTGIDQAVSRRLAGRFDVVEFRREFDRRNGKVTGRYDASVMGFDPYPDSSFFHFSDPSGDPLIAPLTSAAVDLTTRKLNWRPDGSYQSAQRRGREGLGFRPRHQSAAVDRRSCAQILALDPKLKLLVGHGLFDLATPYFGIEDPARPVAGLCRARSRQARGLSRRPHVLFARRLAPGVPQPRSRR